MRNVDEKKLRAMQLLAYKIRRDVVQMIGCKGQTGHLGGSCSGAEITAVLYGGYMRFDPVNPKWEGRDKFVLSKGHAAILQYAAMAQAGYFDRSELWNAKQLGSMLQGHPDRIKTPGIEAGTGSLGQGLSVAAGMALAMRLDCDARKLNGARPGEKCDNRVYCLIGDGELSEGQIWEAAMAAANYKLGNLTAIIDRNTLQATGFIEERFNTNPLKEKWEGFGWHTLEIDGHDVEAIVDAFDEAGSVKDSPSAIIANTVKGKGISFAENQAAFHNGMMTQEQYDIALSELDEVIAELS